MTEQNISAAPHNKYSVEAHRATLDAEGGRLGKLVGIHNVRGAFIVLLTLAFIGSGVLACKDEKASDFFKFGALPAFTLAVGYLAGHNPKSNGNG